MEISTTIGSVLGVYLLVSGVFLITRGKTLPALLKDFFDHKAIVFLTGAVLIFLGGTLAFQEMQEVWVRILGLAILLKGVVYILAPEVLEKISFLRSRRNLSLFGILAMIAGAYLVMM